MTKEQKVLAFLNQLDHFIELKIEWAEKVTIPTKAEIAQVVQVRVELEARLMELIGG